MRPLLIIEPDAATRRLLRRTLRAVVPAEMPIVACAAVEQALTALEGEQATVLVTARQRVRDPWVRSSAGGWIPLQALVTSEFRNPLRLRTALYDTPLDQLALARTVRDLMRFVPLCPE